tara:strand:- start:1031 stop:1708 length:678 start_codon:yes stop_codon:yes gene_type:complete
MKNLSILILCAGFGKRMLDLTTDVPKPLLKIRNRIILGNTINFFKDIGFSKIFINTHYLHKKIEKYIINNFNNSVNLIYEPSILGTGGGVKNIFNYTKNHKICVVNSDILFLKDNKKDLLKFLQDADSVMHGKILLSENKNFFGLKKMNGDFNISNGNISKWKKGNDIIFYSGIQILSKNIFQNTSNIFSINDIWDKLIINKKLKGSFIQSKILHVGDKKSFYEL